MNGLGAPPQANGAGVGLLGLAGAMASSVSSCMPGLWPGPAAASKALHVLRRSA